MDRLGELWYGSHYAEIYQQICNDLISGIEQVRFSAWCSSSNVANTEVGIRKETQDSMKHGINFS